MSLEIKHGEIPSVAAHHNIIIGPGSGMYITDESYKLIVESENIHINETMSEREFKLIFSVIRALRELKYLNDK